MGKEPEYQPEYKGGQAASSEEDIVARGIEAYRPMGKEEQVVTILGGPFDPGGQPELETDNKLILGLYAWNVAGGANLTKAVSLDREKFRDYWSWPNSLRLIKESERIGLEFALPLDRWIGFGGEEGYAENTLDPWVSACALAMHTSRMLLMSAVNVGAHLHPLHVSRLGANFDHVGNGRWALNVIPGWSPAEAEFFGLDSMEHDLRHQLADEFVTLIKHAWSMHAPFEFKGQFFHSKHVLVAGPYPTRRPRPFFLSGAYYDEGIDFAAKQCDWLICRSPSGELADLKNTAVKAKKLATQKYNRYLKSVAPVYCVMAASERAAQDEFDLLGSEIDDEAVGNFIRAFSDQPGEFEGALPASATVAQNNGSLKEAMGDEAYRRVALGLGSLQLVGSYDTVAEMVRLLATEHHQDGLAFAFFDPLKGIHQLEDEIIPRLRKMALRR